MSETDAEKFLCGIEWAEDYIHHIIFNKGLPETKIIVTGNLKLDAVAPYAKGMRTAFEDFLARHSTTVHASYLDSH